MRAAGPLAPRPPGCRSRSPQQPERQAELQDALAGLQRVALLQALAAHASEAAAILRSPLRYVGERSRPPGIVDVGSNSVNLLLCEGVSESAPEGERVTTVTGLRRGAGPDGAIAEDALARLDDCLAGYAGAIAALRARAVPRRGDQRGARRAQRDARGAVMRARPGRRCGC